MDDPARFLVEIALEPKSDADREKLGVALHRLITGDPSFRVSTDPESGQTVLAAPSESDLGQLVGRLKDDFAVELWVGAPQVAYRETLGRKAEIDYTHKKQTGGSGQFARIRLVFEPSEPGSGYSFATEIVDGAVPDEYVPGVEKGLEAAKDNGLLAGFPVIDFKATLVGGAYHDADSSVLAFEIAARAAFRELREKASPKLLEPVMRVEVVAPEEHTRALIGDLNGRRAQIQKQAVRSTETVVAAMVPLSTMFGYESALHLISQGRGQFVMQFDHYAVALQPDDEPPTFPPAMGMRA
jgi:elongation factor G